MLEHSLARLKVFYAMKTKQVRRYCDSEHFNTGPSVSHLHGAHFGLLLQPSVSLLSNSEPDSFTPG